MKKHDFSNHSTVASKLNSGFTLIEIMVALAIVSIAVISIIDAINKHTNVSSELERRIIASWVASNRITEIRHDAKIDRIKEGNKAKSIKMGGFKWRVRAKVKETDVEKVFLVTVEVQDQDRRNENPVSLMTTAITDRL